MHPANGFLPHSLMEPFSYFNKPAVLPPQNSNSPNNNISTLSPKKQKIVELSRITDFIFVGNQVAANSGKDLQDAGITRIIRLRSQPTLAVPDCISSVTFCQIEDLPSSNILSCLAQCLEAIRAARLAHESILVHCHAGKSRSPAIVIAFLMLEHLFTLREAYSHVEKCRNGLAMNPSFKRQLGDFEFEISGRRTVRFCPFCGEFDCFCLQSQQFLPPAALPFSLVKMGPHGGRPVDLTKEGAQQWSGG
ncbi:putative atypical dual specificity phosphatase [Paratrimastix pyriformis]|uniref:protein-tyrosine-phosphatase n=1 Tax=Paratrimastix pyriformis TaxID=342808 RepID=A0ABQ8UW00_9EUKA|nr:putative atypical dual specificity phosphatase [Paratrimastix pyriformis]